MKPSFRHPVVSMIIIDTNKMRAGHVMDDSWLIADQFLFTKMQIAYRVLVAFLWSWIKIKTQSVSHNKSDDLTDGGTVLMD